MYGNGSGFFYGNGHGSGYENENDSAVLEYRYSRALQIAKNHSDKDLSVATDEFTEQLVRTNYTKNFMFMGIPIIQYPTDLMAMQELIFRVQPDLIIECGVAFGGMLAFYATMLEATGHGHVVGIDVDVRSHTRKLLKDFQLSRRLHVIEGDSADPKTLESLLWPIGEEELKGMKVMVTLDSNHAEDHVMKELELYAPLVSVGSYLVVFDTAIEFYGNLDANQDRPWRVGSNPYTAVKKWLQAPQGQCFAADKDIERQILITAAPDGYLKRIAEQKEIAL